MLPNLAAFLQFRQNCQRASALHSRFNNRRSLESPPCSSRTLTERELFPEVIFEGIFDGKQLHTRKSNTDVVNRSKRSRSIMPKVEDRNSSKSFEGIEKAPKRHEADSGIAEHCRKRQRASFDSEVELIDGDSTLVLFEKELDITHEENFKRYCQYAITQLKNLGELLAPRLQESASSRSKNSPEVPFCSADTFARKVGEEVVLSDFMTGEGIKENKRIETKEIVQHCSIGIQTDTKRELYTDNQKYNAENDHKRDCFEFHIKQELSDNSDVFTNPSSTTHDDDEDDVVIIEATESISRQTTRKDYRASEKVKAHATPSSTSMDTLLERKDDLILLETKDASSLHGTSDASTIPGTSGTYSLPGTSVHAIPSSTTMDTLSLPKTNDVLSLQETKDVLSLPEMEDVLNLPNKKDVLSLAETKYDLNLPETKDVLNLHETKDAYSLPGISDASSLPGTSGVSSLHGTSGALSLLGTSGASNLPGTSTFASYYVPMFVNLSPQLRQIIFASSEIGPLSPQNLQAFFSHVKNKTYPLENASYYTEEVDKLKFQLVSIIESFYNTDNSFFNKKDTEFIKWLKNLVNRFDRPLTRRDQRFENFIRFWGERLGPVNDENFLSVEWTQTHDAV